MRKIYIFMITLLFVFALGCETDTGERVDVDEPFIGGTVGLEMKFTQEAPPLEVFDNANGLYQFDVNILVENKGEWDIENKDDAKFTLRGIDVAKDFGLSTSVKELDVPLKRTKKDSQGGIVQGDPTYIEFNDLAYQRETTGTLQLPLWAEACYKYGTNAQTKICVNEELLRDQDTKVCEVNEEKPVENSGAPIHVESLKESASASDQITFTFDVRHLGSGAIYKEGTKCGGNSVRENEDKVKVIVETGIGNAGDLKCLGLRDESSEAGKFSGHTTIYDNDRRSVTCVQKIDKLEDYEKPIEITLEYDYKEHIETTLLVKHSD